MRHRLPVALATAVAALALLLAGATPAGAHEGDAVIELEAAHPAGGSVHFIVRVTWEDDGHPATDATVTATAVSLAGEQLTPVVLPAEDDDGRYSGAVEFPSAGMWTVRFTSIDPTGTLEQIQEVGASPSTVPTTTPAEGDSEVTVGTEADAGFAPEDDGTGASDEDGEAAAADGDGGGLPVWLIVLAAVVAVGGAVAAHGTIRRYRGGPGPGAGPADDPSPEPEPVAETAETAEAPEPVAGTAEAREPTGPAGGTGP